MMFLSLCFFLFFFCFLFVLFLPAEKMLPEGDFLTKNPHNTDDRGGGGGGGCGDEGSGVVGVRGGTRVMSAFNDSFYSDNEEECLNTLRPHSYDDSTDHASFNQSWIRCVHVISPTLFPHLLPTQWNYVLVSI